jgi:hypothetical protein
MLTQIHTRSVAPFSSSMTIAIITLTTNSAATSIATDSIVVDSIMVDPVAAGWVMVVSDTAGADLGDLIASSPRGVRSRDRRPIPGP